MANRDDLPPADEDIPSEVEASEWIEDNPGDPDNPHRAAGRSQQDMIPTGGFPRYGFKGKSAAATPGKVLTVLLRREIEALDYSAPVNDDPERMNEPVTVGASIVRRLVNIILTGRDRDSIEAAKIAWAYLDGLPVQPIEFDISKVVAELAEARGLSEEDTRRALDETRRVLNAAKNGTPVGI